MMKFIFISTAVLVIVFIAAGFYFYGYALSSKRGSLPSSVPETVTEPVISAWSKDNETEWLQKEGYDVWIKSKDGLRLHGRRVDAHTGKYVIAVHGYAADGESMSAFGKRFYDMGYTVLLPDLRGHGLSSGLYIGMGWHDRLDIIGWIRDIVREDPRAKIVLFGISMGGATVMMTAGEPLPSNVKAVIEDCGYTSVWDEFSTQLRDRFGLPTFPFMQAASLATKLRAGFWLSEADTVKQVRRSALPILFIHGEIDTFVPFRMFDALYDAAPGAKEKLVIPGAGHGMASFVNPDLYWLTVARFTERHLQ